MKLQYSRHYKKVLIVQKHCNLCSCLV